MASSDFCQDLYVILSMSSEQTCLQGFVSEDIHKAQAF